MNNYHRVPFITPEDCQYENRRGHRRIYSVLKRFDHDSGSPIRNDHHFRAEFNVVGEQPEYKELKKTNPGSLDLDPPISRYQ